MPQEEQVKSLARMFAERVEEGEVRVSHSFIQSLSADGMRVFESEISKCLKGCYVRCYEDPSSMEFVYQFRFEDASHV